MERFRLFLSRPIEGKIKTVTIRHASAGKWFVSFSCDGVPEKRLAPTGKEVGIDVGIKALCVDSDGGRVENPKFLRESERLLRRRQRSLSRKRRGPARRAKVKRLVAVCPRESLEPEEGLSPQDGECVHAELRHDLGGRPHNTKHG
ncbi:MAG: transposase [Syntrophorhabdaceae bacterium]|nr:transposase [Syntrophorhabdaceae bacterium]